jgi:hypothetical protein
MRGDASRWRSTPRSNAGRTILEATVAALVTLVTCSFGRDGRIRTGGLLLPNQIRGVAGLRWVWPCIGLSCNDDCPLLPGVAGRWWSMPPNLAPREPVRLANVRNPEQVIESFSDHSPRHLGRPAGAGSGSTNSAQLSWSPPQRVATLRPGLRPEGVALRAVRLTGRDEPGTVGGWLMTSPSGMGTC